jgi:hypothetical protein
MTDTLEDLRALIPQLGPATERRALGERLTSLTIALREAPAEFERLDALLDLAAWTNFPGRELLEELEDAAADLASSLCSAQTPDELRTAQDRHGAFQRAMSRVAPQISAHWRGIVTRDYGPLIGFGELLARVDSLVDLGKRMQSCGQEAVDSANSSRPQDLRIAVARLNGLADALQSEREEKLEAVPGVGEFLSAIGAQNATLAVVTKDVLDWLTANGGLERFRVST